MPPQSALPCLHPSAAHQSPRNRLHSREFPARPLSRLSIVVQARPVWTYQSEMLVQNSPARLPSRTDETGCPPDPPRSATARTVSPPARPPVARHPATTVRPSLPAAIHLRFLPGSPYSTLPMPPSTAPSFARGRTRTTAQTSVGYSGFVRTLGRPLLSDRFSSLCVPAHRP